MIDLVALHSQAAGQPVHVGQVAVAAAALCLVFALLCMRSALAPVGPLVRVVVAVTGLALAMIVALVLLIAAALQ